MSALNRPIADHEYVCSVWFERDRQNISLATPSGRVIFDLWDDAVSEAIEDGYLSAPRGPLMSSRSANDESAWQPHAVEYARSMGLIK